MHLDERLPGAPRTPRLPRRWRLPGRHGLRRRFTGDRLLEARLGLSKPLIPGRPRLPRRAVAGIAAAARNNDYEKNDYERCGRNWLFISTSSISAAIAAA